MFALHFQTDILDRNVQYTVRYFIGADSEPVTYSSTKYKYYVIHEFQDVHIAIFVYLAKIM